MKQPEDKSKKGERQPEPREIKFPIIKGDGKRKINLTREQIDEAMFG